MPILRDKPIWWPTKPRCLAGVAALIIVCTASVAQAAQARDYATLQIQVRQFIAEGDPGSGLALLTSAIDDAPAAGEQANALKFLLATHLYELGRIHEVQPLLDELLAAQTTDLKQRAAVQNLHGLVAQAQDQKAEAAVWFTDAAALDPEQLSYPLNAARATLDEGDVDTALTTLTEVVNRLKGNPALHSLDLSLSAAKLLRKAVNEYYADPDYRRMSFELLQLILGEKLSPLARAQVYEQVAELYQDEAQHDAARHYATLALPDIPDSRRFRLHWISARGYASEARLDEAAREYQLAIDALTQHGPSGQHAEHFATIVRPLHYEYADVALAASPHLPAERQTATLLAVRDALEQSKAAEIQDYFNEECVTIQPTALEEISSQVAVIYPILLEDRLEILLATNDGIEQTTVRVAERTLSQSVRALRAHLQNVTGTRDYLEHAGALYRWLIAPIKAQLEQKQIATLVIVPDGVLRTIPLAALHDGSQYLIEHYGLATTPGLTLLDPQPYDSSSEQVLAGGISESVQGFAALPSVADELATLANVMNAELLENQAFTQQTLATTLQSGNHSLIHLATHGQFASDFSNSYLLTHDSRLTMNQLGTALQSRSDDAPPLELLVLSACETATGDDRAALGLAGVAIKSGARSTLATLWEVDDRATLELVDQFYRGLRNKERSKAESLRAAQRHLLQQKRYEHPSYWAPFLLIGNWL